MTVSPSQKMRLQKPPPLKPGDTIAVVAPASPFDREALERGVERIKSWGYQVQHREDLFARKRYLAGDDQRRFTELKEALENPQIKAIFVARGGYGSMRLLPFLKTLPKDLPPKIVLGYSDLTSLLNFIGQHWAWVTFHGPVVAKDIGDRLGEAGEQSLKRVLTDPTPLGKLTPLSLISLVPGQATGSLVGGCLSLIHCTLGTPYQLNTKGCVLYLEDVGELLYSLDRMFTHLRLARIFDQVKGIVIGPLKDAHDSTEVIQEMLLDVLGDLKIPMVFGFPSGHVEDMWTIPLGLPVSLDAGEPSLTFLEGALAEG